MVFTSLVVCVCAVIEVSTMKCGLLPLCHKAMTLGEIAYSEYTGGGPDDVASMQKALSSNAKVRYHSLVIWI